ncbi:MAG: hypothetical protein RLZZ271_173 [Pseudomonadota bacterium]|jgi:uncharacterized protein YjeT (DUF2065 family)
MSLSDKLWLAFALMLVFEGLMPLISPASWRKLFEQILKLNDGQIRFYGLTSVGLGLLVLLLFT